MLAPFTHMTTQAVPLTVAPVVGCVIATWSEPVGAGVGVGVGVGVGTGIGAGVTLTFDVVTRAEPVPVLPLESRTPIDSVCVPLATFVVSIGIDTGPLPPVCVPSDVPSMVTVNVLLPLEPATHTTAHEMPLSVAPEGGCVRATVNPPVGAGVGVGGGVGVGVGVVVGVGVGSGAGVGFAFDVFTVTLPLPVLPVESFTPTLSV